MLPRKQPSGAENRKRKLKDVEMAKSLHGSLNRFLIKKPTVSESTSNVPVDNAHDPPNDPVENNSNDPVGNETDDFVDKDNPNDFNIFDPRVWDNLDSTMKDLLIEKGPSREVEKDTIFPKDAYNRQFSYDYFTRKLSK